MEENDVCAETGGGKNDYKKLLNLFSVLRYRKKLDVRGQ